jgi:methyl-accepting chemotaxis protein
MKIGARLAIGFLAVLLLVGASAMAGVWRLGELGAIIGRIVTQDAAKLVLAEQWEKHIAVNLVRTHNSMQILDGVVAEGLRKDMDATSAQISGLQKQIEEVAVSAEEKRLLAGIGEVRSQYREQRAAMLKRKNAGENVGDELKKNLEPLAESYLGAVHSFVAYQQKQLEAAKVFADDAVRNTRVLMIAMALIGVIAALGAAILIARSILGPIGEARAGAARIAAGDLTQDLAIRGRDEIAELMVALAGMQDGLRRIAGDVRRAADTVNTASQEIAQGHADLSSRTEEQASSLEETAASMEEMTATVLQNAENAKKASHLASGATEIATRGGEAVGAVVGTMTGISESSKKIADIIGVIDGIAFQTNILALNAAVEAARAGEQGRGFAVVASEVRNLAQRSSGAAKEIRQLISESVARVDTGSRQVAQAGGTIAEVVSAVQGVNKLVAEISAASQEQSQSISQVSDTVQQLEKVTQQNAAMVEQATAAAGSLEEQASVLIHAVGSFKLSGTDRIAPQGTAGNEQSGAKPAGLPSASVRLLPKRTKEPVPATSRIARKRAAGGGSTVQQDWEEF